MNALVVRVVPDSGGKGGALIDVSVWATAFEFAIEWPDGADALNGALLLLQPCSCDSGGAELRDVARIEPILAPVRTDARVRVAAAAAEDGGDPRLIPTVSVTTYAPTVGRPSFHCALQIADPKTAVRRVVASVVLAYDVLFQAPGPRARIRLDLVSRARGGSAWLYPLRKPMRLPLQVSTIGELCARYATLAVDVCPCETKATTTPETASSAGDDTAADWCAGFHTESRDSDLIGWPRDVTSATRDADELVARLGRLRVHDNLSDADTAAVVAWWRAAMPTFVAAPPVADGAASNVPWNVVANGSGGAALRAHSRGTHVRRFLAGWRHTNEHAASFEARLLTRTADGVPGVLLTPRPGGSYTNGLLYVPGEWRWPIVWTRPLSAVHERLPAVAPFQRVLGAWSVADLVAFGVSDGDRNQLCVAADACARGVDAFVALAWRWPGTELRETPRAVIKRT